MSSRRESDIDLVLLDLMMPHLSGLDVLARIRATERLKHLPCIILTAAGQEAQHQRAMELGATEFLTKPFSPKKLYARTAELAGLSQDEHGVGDVVSRWAVVLAGGVGSRFWPLSTPTRPKQLLPLVDDRPLLVATLDRLAPLVPPTHTLVLTNASWCDTVALVRTKPSDGERHRGAARRRHGRRAGMGRERDRTTRRAGAP